MRKFLFLAGWIILASSGAFAVDNNALTFRTIAPESSETDFVPLAFLKADGKPQTIEIPRYNLSPYFQFPKAASLQLFDKMQLDDFLAGKIKNLPAPVYNIPVPDGSSSFILVFERKNQKDWIPFLVSDAAKAFPGGSRLFINLTSNDLKGTIEAASFAVPKSSLTVVPIDSLGAETERRNVQVFAEVSGASKLIASTRWTFNSKRRGVVVIFKDPQAGDFRLFAIPDSVPESPLTP